MGRLRFAKTEAGKDKQHSVKPYMNRSSSANGVQQENRRSEEEVADEPLSITSEGCEGSVEKDVEQVEISTNGLATNEESGKEGSLIDLEKEEEEEEEEEEEGQILDVESLLSVPAHPECVTLVDESAYGSWRDYLVTMTVTGALVELQRERMDEFVAIGAVVPQESVPLIVLRDATYVIRKVCHWKGMIEVFGVLYCIKIAPGNYLLTHNAGTAALHMCAPSSDSAHSMSALLLASSQSAQACACLSPAATRSFVIVQPFYQPELLCIPYEQFFLKSH
ncbi:uncharacterized protein MONOS_12495 [Monocercomonoides exilis]|uniref:uncharacterized protein n=1 Tax=Monocercomonoides exilis TaxID=2049356 RepID=UPI003559A1EC|nr:hypothetical protein MONOS_12495 [Monocercomonoides exilis]|eukprot:MONOS_12495.1-p1 / transcript=MONOS_12495.1 / gene=MONOS_12495 / organism=Monocercomonoides_exilis_PA203 / gene_product=unspecified product / transcript_product=unspecified product / location=Mono_scaffold00695:11661-12766(+) / protein_length=279 / sequence_SO=supercontig / SO=protein_coding / is_pseudo=false